MKTANRIVVGLFSFLSIAAATQGAGPTSVDAYAVFKKMDYLQNSSAAPVSHAISGDPNGPFHFVAALAGSNLNLLSPGLQLRLPNATQYSLTGDSTWVGLEAGYATKSALDGAFPNGSYTFTGGAFSLPISLGATDVYSAEIPQITNGAWDAQGRLAINATSGAMLTFNYFSSYASGVGGMVVFSIYSVYGDALGSELVTEGSTALSGYPSDPILLSYSIPPGLLAAGQTYYAELSFIRLVALNADFSPAMGMAGFIKTTGWNISTAGPASVPIITQQPVSQAVTAGSTVTFTASASGTPAPSYQWRKNTVNIPGAINDAYTIANAQAGDAGTYSVVATNSAGFATSNGATLTVTAATLAPSFTLQPLGQTVAPSQTATFTAAASGTPAPTYQWRKNGGNLPGATGTTLVIPHVSPGDAGAYAVVATNTAGSVVSTTATLTVLAVGADFNTDGKSDILWQNATTGERGTWLMNGTVISSWVSFGNVPTTWRISGTGDFNGNGKADILWENAATGEHILWLMNGTAFAGWFNFGAVPVGWRAVGCADFDGNGSTDILWENTATGEHGIWLMNGTTIAGWVSYGLTATQWRMTAIGDLNTDGKPDILWENTATGEHGVWLMNGTAFASWLNYGVSPLAWHLAATGDFNDDGKTDILWENTVTGERGLWLMNGTSFSSWQSLGIVPVDWCIVP